MKNLIAVLPLVFISASAFAEPVVDYLSVSSRSGTVNPMYATSKNCTIRSDGTVSIRTIVGDIANGKTKKVVWKGIPNDTVLQSLIVESSKGQVVVAHQIPPVGGGKTAYVSHMKGKTIALKVTIGGSLQTINTSAATERLVKFVDVNCGKN
ncbi:MAG: hypothetical protein JST80_00115 [Bdellovibrionales bacterium]|nr:hypothetical protein [Bdellovibrionales bacterium]